MKRRLAYPAAMAAALGVFGLCTWAGAGALLAGYAGAAFGALEVLWLERALPFRKAWHPPASEVATDAIYLALVQMALPLLLSLTLAVGIGRMLHTAGVPVATFWPHHWPVVAQAGFMLLAADLLRYGLHVAAHRIEPLWRLHAVHHAPERLYWLSVGRFHPLEKAAQYLLDALPFALMGVSEPVLGLYFVFYATNGFFQHGNVDVCLGWLNQVISGPELHRWHHSREPGESNANYGNNLILWDTVFGTRFLPRDREVEELGLPNREYPTGFLQQLRAPFVAGIEVSPGFVPSWTDLLALASLSATAGFTRMRDWPRLRRAAQQPRETQLEKLREILAANRDTRFGREHGFAEIRSHAEYTLQVPVQDYESLRPYVDAQDRAGEPALTSEPPVLYAQTSGTTGEPKLVPVLERSLREHRLCQRLFFAAQCAQVPGAYAGKLLAIVSPAVEGARPSGTPFGSASGHLYRGMPAALRSKYVLPWQVFTLADYDLKYLLIVRLALSQPDITYMASANPSTFIRLLEVLEKHRASLSADVRFGGFSRMRDLPADVCAAIGPRLRCTPERAAFVEKALSTPHPSIADLWPNLRLLSTWTGGSCGIALDSVRRELPPQTRVSELGYLASELLGTVTPRVDSTAGVPTLCQNFFEFVEREGWERGDREFLTLDRLEEGSEYYVIVTTSTGLYRYFMNDVVRVHGRFEETPTLRFLQKGRGVTSITGEKLYESQVLEAVPKALAEQRVDAPFWLLLADEKHAHYRLLIEPRTPSLSADALARAVDRALRAGNGEYAEKRASERLGPVYVHVLAPGASDSYKRACLARGQREGQFKVQVLQRLEELAWAWQEHESEDSA